MSTFFRRGLPALIMLLFASVGLAQHGEGASTQEEPAAVISGQAEVQVNDEPADDRIDDRLTGILNATERFESLDVEVRDGVVFLSGIAKTEDDRKLAADLATRTSGVAAVVNNLSLPVEPVWTIAPALDELDKLARSAVRSAPLLLVGMLVLLLSLAISRLVGRLTESFIAPTTDSELLRNVVRKAVTLIVIVVGLYLALRITGLTRIALTVISGTGLLGLALGFAFRDIAENYLASLLLSIQRPFRLGDVVEVDGHTGIVRKVTSRGTLLIDFDGNHIQIANATVYKNTIKNFTANPLTRIHFSLGIGYDDTISHAQEVTRQVLSSHPAVLVDPEPLVLVHELGSSTVNLRVYFWINATEHSMLKVKSSTIRLVTRALTDAGVSMPDEAREVIFPQGVPVMLPDGDSQSRSQTKSEDATRETPDHHERRDEIESIVVEAEGDLVTETIDLKWQAERARDPEEGANVLADDAATSSERSQAS